MDQDCVNELTIHTYKQEAGSDVPFPLQQIGLRYGLSIGGIRKLVSALALKHRKPSQSRDRGEAKLFDTEVYFVRKC